MNEQIVTIMLGFGIFGSMLLIMAVGAKLGYFRSWYLFKGLPGYPAGYVYGMLPIGIFCLMVIFAVFVLDQTSMRLILGYSVWPILLFSIILMIWKPRWLKPWWLIWLEDNYGDVLDVMLEGARNTPDFAQQTPTETELAVWAEEVLGKYRWR